MTNAGSMSWLYEYQQDNNADNLPTIQAFAASHEPSPWMGDRQTFQVMPSTGEHARSPTARRARSPFRHANEIARPYYYGVTFENGLKTEIAPTDHAALLRFTFPGDDFEPGLRQRQRRRRADDRPAHGRGHRLLGRAQRPVQRRHAAVRVRDVRPPDDGRAGRCRRTARPAGYVRFDARTVTMRIATSLISVDQAQAQPRARALAGRHARRACAPARSGCGTTSSA